jgi:hypothetical protein
MVYYENENFTRGTFSQKGTWKVLTFTVDVLIGGGGANGTVETTGAGLNHTADWARR